MARSARAGELRTYLTARVEGFRRGMAQATQKTREQKSAARQLNREWYLATRQVRGYVSQIVSLRTAFTLLLGGGFLGGFVRSTAAMGAELSATYRATGIATETMQIYRRVMNNAGIDASNFDKALQALTRRLGAAQLGDPTYSRFFRILGVEIFNAAGEAKNLGQVLEEVLLQMARVSRERAAGVAGDLFGRSGLSLLSYVRQGEAVINRDIAASREIGATSLETAQRLEAVDAALNDLTDAFRGVPRGGAGAVR